MESTRIVYSKYKSKSPFYRSGVHIVEFYDAGNEEMFMLLISPENKEYKYSVTDVKEVGSNQFISILNLNTGSPGVLKLIPYGKAELDFGTGVPIHLKV